VAQRLPLNADEQDQVNRAIDRGVAFLKATQGVHGSWRNPKESHPIGYAALPGLTLLECGVPPADPAVQRVARLVRRSAANLDATYEIALSLLFLDRLGDPKDKPIIRTLAVRLMAGQTVTGGWGYRCPKVGAVTQQDILVTLRKLDPGLPMMIPRPGEPGNPLPAIGDGPGPGAVVRGDRPGPGLAVGERPGVGGRPVEGKPSGLNGGVTGAGATTPGTSIGERDDKLSGGTTGSKPAGTPGTVGGGTPAPGGEPGRAGEMGEGKDARPRPPAQRDPPSLGAPRRGWCIKSSDWAADRESDRQAWKPPPAPRLADVVPARLRNVPVFIDIGGPVADPANRASQPLNATTDNSNTQFALLALWAAQRHDVPVRRSMDLLVRRFKTSQNGDGSWGYHYRFGGGDPERPAMTCVGLLGLAVGHGIAGRHAGGGADPAIVKGMVALTKHVGEATGQREGVKQINLYVLWSIERVAVLYDLPTIGGKDWYRWAAEMLVLNQQREGHWTNGGYHQATPIIDTCLALLVLKKANLIRDLAVRLPFDPGALERSIIAGVKRPEHKPPERKPDPPPAPTPPPAPPPLEGTPTRVSNPDTTASPAPIVGTSPTPTEQPAEGSSSSRIVLILLLLFVLLALLIGGACLFFFGQNRPAEDEEEERPRRRPRPRRRGD
jgi:hypothetical protein